MSGTKVATCCYCGTRAALVLTGETRHELACAKCGAPLHDLKQMPSAAGGTSARAATPAHPARTLRVDHRAPKKVKRRKSMGLKIAKGLWDVVEEIFD